MFVYIPCRRRRISSFLFPAETDVLVPVLSQSTDVVVVNFVVVLKFPIGVMWTGIRTVAEVSK